MKVLYITSSWFIDGDFPLIKNLIDKGIQVFLIIKVYTNHLTSTILSLKEAYHHQGIFESSVYGNEIDKFKSYLGLDQIRVINHIRGDNSLRNYNLLIEEKELIQSIQPDVIHYISMPSLYELPLVYLYGKRMVVTVHDPIPHEINFKSRSLRLVRVLFQRRIKRYILLNKTQSNAFSQYYKIPLDRIRYSELGNYDIITVFGKERQNSGQNILFWGRISPYKGVEYLLDAFSRIQTQFPNSHLIIAGSGNYYFPVDKYSSNKSITFINDYISTEELATLIRDSAFVVCPYVSATQSGVIASAFALGKPVIATRVGGLPEMIDDGRTGLIVSPKDPIELGKAMSYLLNNPHVLKQMSNNIKADGEKGNHSWNKISEGYIEIYRDLLASD